jgi:hypothetical protein
MKIEEMRNYFAPVASSGERLPEKERLADGSFFLFQKGGLRILFIYLSGERLQVATLPMVLKKLPSTEGMPENTRFILENGALYEEYIIVSGKWKKIE